LFNSQDVDAYATNNTALTLCNRVSDCDEVCVEQIMADLKTSAINDLIELNVK